MYFPLVSPRWRSQLVPLKTFCRVETDRFREVVSTATPSVLLTRPPSAVLELWTTRVVRALPRLSTWVSDRCPSESDGNVVLCLAPTLTGLPESAAPDATSPVMG